MLWPFKWILFVSSEYFHVILLDLCILQNLHLKFLVCFGANLVTSYLWKELSMESIMSTVTRSAPSKDCFLLSCLRSVSSFSSTDPCLEISEGKHDRRKTLSSQQHHMDIIGILSPTIVTRGNIIVKKRFLFLRATVSSRVDFFSEILPTVYVETLYTFHWKGLKKDNTHVFSCETQLLLWLFDTE